MSLLVNNPIAWAQFRAKGGYRMLGIVGAAYTMIVVVIAVITLNSDPLRTSRAAASLAYLLLAIQLVLLGLVGSAMIGNAIRNEINQRLLESHRLMPLPSSHAVAGYLLGPSRFVLLMGAINLLAGMILGMLGGITPVQWIYAHIVLAVAALFYWVLTVFACFVGRSGTGIMVGLLMGAGMASYLVLMYVPGLLVLATPIHGGTIFSLKEYGAALSIPTILAILAQISIGSIFFVGAMRKYRGVEGPSMSMGLGLSLLAGWVVLSWAGIEYWGEYASGMVGRFRDQPVAQQIAASISLGLVVALAPLTAAAWSDDRIRLRRVGESTWKRSAIAIVCVTIILAMISLLALARPGLVHPFGRHLVYLQSIAIIFIHCISIILITRACYRMARGAMGMIIVWFVFVWLVPVIVDAVSLNFTSSNGRQEMGAISTISPIVALHRTWESYNSRQMAMKGCVGQMVLLGVLIAWQQFLRPLKSKAQD